MQYIQSTQNKTYKLIKSLKQKKTRTEEKLYCVEGIKGSQDAIKAGADIKIIGVKKEILSKLENALLPFDDILYVIDDAIFDAVCDTKTPEGIICVIKMHECDTRSITNGLYIYLDHISDPGNLGTIIRTLDACGGSGIMLSPECADLYNPKTVRSSMGSFFSSNTYSNIGYDELINLKEKGFKIICAALNDDAKDFKTVSFPENSVIVIGNEANGITDKCLSLADEVAIIPILGNAESLNASIAAGILMYEWQRNNRLFFKKQRM